VLVGTNTFSGNYTLSAGVLSVSADGNFGNTTTGSTLVLNGATAVLDVTAAMLVNGQHHISAGVSGGTIEGIGGGNLTLAGSVLSSSGPNPMTIASDTAGATVLTMSSAQSLTGPVTLASGRILDSSTSSTPFGSATVTVLAGAQIEFSGNVSYQSKLNIAGSGSDGRGALVFDGVTNSFTHLGNLTLTADSTLGYVGTAGGTISISSGLLGAFNLTLGGFLGSTAATWTVAAPATATPNIVVSATSSVQTLAMLTSSYAGVLSGGGNVVIGSTLSGMNTYGGTTTLSSDSTTTLTGGDNRLPAGTTLRFGFNGVATDGLNVGSTNQTFASILFANSSSFTPAESAVINGAGSVTVTGRGDLVLGPADSNVRGAALYMAGLGTFDFASPSNAFRVELPATYASNGVLGNPLDTVELAAVSTIAASLLDVGNQGGFSQIFTTPIVLALGKTNIIDTPEIDVGYGSETSATLDFKSSTGPPTVMIRNADGVSPVDTWLVGDIDAPATPNFLPEQSIVDLSAGTTDAKVHALTLGSGVLTSGVHSGSGFGVFTLGATPASAPFSVSALLIGTISGGGPDSSTQGTYETGGAFVLTNGGELDAQNITLASNTINDTTAGVVRSVVGILQITNGTLIASSISRGPQTGTASASATMTWTNGTLQNTPGANLVVSGVPITVTSTNSHIINVSAGQTLTLDAGSPLVGSGGSIIKTGSGTLVLDALNTYTGSLVVNGGSIELGNPHALDSFSNVTGGSQGPNHLNGIDESLLLGTTASVDNEGAVAATATIASTTGTLSGLLSDGGPAPLNIVVARAVNITGTNTFTGTTTVDPGVVFRVTGSDPSSAITLSGAGAQLSGGNGIKPGTVASVLVNAGSVLAPGGTATTSAGLLSAASVTMATGSTFTAEINSIDANTIAGADYDQLNVTGTLALGGATLNLGLPSARMIPGSVYVLATAATVTGTFASMPNGSLINAGNDQELVLNYTGTAVTLTVPATLYVSSTWAGLQSGQSITDANLTDGNTLTFGVTAFANATTAMQAIVPGESLYLNPGNYSEQLASPIPGSLLYIQVRGNVAFSSLGNTPAGAMQMDIRPNGGQFSFGFDNSSTTFASTIVGGGSLSKSGTGTFFLDGTDAAGLTAIAAGKIQVDATGTLSSIFVDDRSALVLDSPSTVTFSPQIFDNGSVTQAGTGTVVLTGPNHYTGLTDVAAGTLKVATPPTTPVVTNGGFETPVLTANTTSFSPSGATWAFGTGASGMGAAGIVAGNGGIGAPTSPSGSQAGILKVDGTLSQSISFANSGNFVLNFSAAGLPSANGVDPIKVLLDGTQVGSAITPSSGSYSTYSIRVGVGSGGSHTIEFEGGSSTPSLNLTSFVDAVSFSFATFQAVEVDAGGTLDLAGNSASMVTLVGSGQVTNSSTTAGALTVGILDGSSTFAGVVQNGSSSGVAVTKAGAGTLTLSGANTYTGPTTVSAGSLLVSGSLAASSAVSIAAGATLGGTGSVGDVTNGGGTVSPGTPTGTLSVRNLTLGPGTLFIDLPTAASIDEIVASGSSVDITGTALSLSAGSLVGGGPYTILSVSGTSGGLVGTFTNLPSDGSTLTIGQQTFRIDYTGGDGNDVVLAAETTVTAGVPVLNGGLGYVESTLAAQQHSMIENVVYSFSSAVSLSAANFALTGLSGTTLVPSVKAASENNTASDTVWTVTFSGVGVNAGTHSIGDGEYQLVLSGVPGLADNTFDFFRLLGDMDGNGTVNTSDFATLISTFLRATDDPLYLGADDFDGDSTIGTTDFAQFSANFLKSLPTPLPN
jgi:autotransporter-associated beta strand protein